MEDIGLVDPNRAIPRSSAFTASRRVPEPWRGQRIEPLLHLVTGGLWQARRMGSARWSPAGRGSGAQCGAERAGGRAACMRVGRRRRRIGGRRTRSARPPYTGRREPGRQETIQGHRRHPGQTIKHIDAVAAATPKHGFQFPAIDHGACTPRKSCRTSARGDRTPHNPQISHHRVPTASSPSTSSMCRSAPVRLMSGPCPAF